MRCNRITWCVAWDSRKTVCNKHLHWTMTTRATKLRASISKSHVPIDGIDNHFVEQRDALQSIYACAIVLTQTEAKYVLHVQRDGGLKLSSRVMQRALSDNNDPPTRYTHMTGTVLRRYGEIREQGGAGKGVYGFIR